MSLPFSDHNMATLSFGSSTWLGWWVWRAEHLSLFLNYKNVPGFQIYLYFIIWKNKKKRKKIILTNLYFRLVFKNLPSHFSFSGDESQVWRDDCVHRDQSLCMWWHRHITVLTCMGPDHRKIESWSGNRAIAYPPRVKTPKSLRNNLHSPRICQKYP